MHCNRRKNNPIFFYTTVGTIVFLHSLGRKQPLAIPRFQALECPLSMKADVQPGTTEIGLPNGCFAPGTGH